MTDSSDLSQRALEETYAPQYEAVVRQGGAGAVMCSYNRIDSVYACENPSVLDMLDGQFGFTGFTVSDWGATHSTIASARAGLLKNQGGVLPITGRGKTIAVIGQPAGPAGAENEYNGGAAATSLSSATFPSSISPVTPSGLIRSTARDCWSATAGTTPSGSRPRSRSASGWTSRRSSTPA